MAKRDYYEVLGVSKNASADEIKKPTENWPFSITRIKIQIILKPKTNSKKQLRHMRC